MSWLGKRKRANRAGSHNNRWQSLLGSCEGKLEDTVSNLEAGDKGEVDAPELEHLDAELFGEHSAGGNECAASLDVTSVITSSWGEAATALADLCTTILSTAHVRSDQYPPRVIRAAIQYLQAWNNGPSEHRRAPKKRELKLRSRPYRFILPAVPRPPTEYVPLQGRQPSLKT